MFKGLVGIVEQFLDLECEIDKLKNPGQVRHVGQVGFPGLAVD